MKCDPSGCKIQTHFWIISTLVTAFKKDVSIGNSLEGVNVVLIIPVESHNFSFGQSRIEINIHVDTKILDTLNKH